MTEKPLHAWQTEAVLWGKLKQPARGLRKSSTAEESLLWEQLRNGKFHGVHFRRQHTVGQFILDFYAWKASVAIEVDGPIHESNHEQDLARDTYLTSQGIRVLRFSNDEVQDSMPLVLATIARALRLPSPPGEGTEG